MEVDPSLKGAGVLALVTGGNRGIGLQCVKRLCEELGDKGKVVMCARQRPQEVLDTLHKDGHKHVVFFSLDITKEKSINELKAWVRDQGGADVLINNAGIAFKVDSTEDFSVQARQTMDTNFWGTKRMMDALIPVMKRHGRIINISSSSGQLSSRSAAAKEILLSPDATCKSLCDAMESFVKAAQEDRVESSGWWKNAYGVSKAGVTHLTRAVARDACPGGDVDSEDRKIFVASCCPGICRTDMTCGSNTIMGWIVWIACWVIGHSAYVGADTPVYLAVMPWEKTRDFHGKFVFGRKVSPY